ncbi:MAG: hypothetical protein FVQ83_02910 [Chloroflexi bacterium]|nr:hypothetical protein [Chloroflexota bacterium]
MKNKNLSLWGILGLVIVIVAIISWFAFPSWKDQEGGVWQLLGIVAVGVVSITKDLVAIAKDVKEMQEKEALKKKQPSSRAASIKKVEAKGERSVAIGGSAKNAVIVTGDNNEVAEKNKE